MKDITSGLTEDDWAMAAVAARTDIITKDFIFEIFSSECGCSLLLFGDQCVF